MKPTLFEVGAAEISIPCSLAEPKLAISGSKLVYLGTFGAKYHRLVPSTLKLTFPKAVFFKIFEGKSYVKLISLKRKTVPSYTVASSTLLMPNVFPFVDGEK